MTKTPTRRRRSAPRDPESSRRRIFEAARIRFSACSYEGVGIRDIAADAGVDPALVIRHFGSKEELFRAVADAAFDTDALLGEVGITGLPANASRLLMADWDAERWLQGYNPLRLFLASIGSPVAGPILAASLDRNFTIPLAEAASGPIRGEVGTMVASQILGMALMRIVMAWGHGRTNSEHALARLFENSLKMVTATDLDR